MSGFELTPEEIRLFLDEAFEQVQLLEEGLIDLEEQPNRMDIVQEIFRAAHTLKGGAATAGFDQVAELTHAMETLLDLVRQGKTTMTSEIADRLLSGVDVLRASLVAIEQEGAPDRVDVSSALSSLLEGVERSLMPSEETPDTTDPLLSSVQRDDAPSQTEPEGVWGLTVTISADALMPSVRAYQVLLTIEDHARVVRTQPPREEIEGDGVDVHQVTVYVQSDVPFERLQKIIEEIPDVSKVEYVAPAAPQSPSAPKGGADRRSTEAAPAPNAAPGSSNGELGQTIRVDVGLLDALMNLVGELVIDRTRLAQLGTLVDDPHELQEELNQVSGRLSRITTDLQDAIMRARMMPVEALFKKFPRMVRDLSRQLNKPIHFEMTGQETELDRSVIELIGDPLIHLLRNAIDHGIEPVEQRRKAGKPDEGHVHLHAYHQENHIFIEVSDDGRGLDLDVLRTRAVEKGIVEPEEAERLSDEETAELIFAPGFTTATDVSAVSGRGVGMDVVRQNIERVNGSVFVDTEKGKGTTITIKLPLTLVILQALLVEIADYTFAIPLTNVTEAVLTEPTAVHYVKGWEMIAVRDEMVPLLNPGTIWGKDWSISSKGDQARMPVVVLRSANSPLGLKVDRLIGEEEVVIKSMGPIIGDIPGISGASILGDGRVALIVDPASLTKAVKGMGR